MALEGEVSIVYRKAKLVSIFLLLLAKKFIRNISCRFYFFVKTGRTSGPFRVFIRFFHSGLAEDPESHILPGDSGGNAHRGAR